MPTISHITKEIIHSNTFLQEAITEGIISYQKLAEYIQPYVEKKAERNIKISAIMMAIRRYEDELKQAKSKRLHNYFDEITIKTDIAYILLEKNKSTLDQVHSLNEDMLAQNKGDLFHINYSADEIGIITSNVIARDITSKLKKETIKRIIINLCMITLRYTPDHTDSSENLSNIFWLLARENIKVDTWINNSSELSIVLNQKDVIPTYRSLLKLKKTIEITPSIDKKDKIKITKS